MVCGGWKVVGGWWWEVGVRWWVVGVGWWVVEVVCYHYVSEYKNCDVCSINVHNDIL